MKLTPPDKPIGDNGPNVFPWVCPHCHRCYWLYPGVDIVARRSLARPEEMEEDACREAWQAEDIKDNIGLQYAMDLMDWAKEAGKIEGIQLERLNNAIDQGVKLEPCSLTVELLKDGQALRFPMICPHCAVTYWYQPNDELRGLMPAECAAAVFKELDEGKENKGSAWWKVLWNDAIEQGKKAGTQPRLPECSTDRKKAAPGPHKEPEAATAKEEA